MLQCVSVMCFTDIQEIYEVTLLNTQKSCEQKLEEINHMADKWEQTGTGFPTTVLQHACPTEVSLMGPQSSGHRNIMSPASPPNKG